VLVDAPCTGSGVWRRRPDATWRVRPSNLPERQAEQRRILTLARSLVRPGGRLTYVTCSVLPEENTDNVRWLLESFLEFKLKPFAESWRVAFGTEPPTSADGDGGTLLLTPASHGTDGFFIATFERGN
jgi:16S rRNA (cytosine967-C5)-methyltransferase